MNYSVHALMYTYYGLSAMGYRLSWARVVTVCQLGQMVVGVCVCLAVASYRTTGMECAVETSSFALGSLMYGSYFLLFLSFFVGRYYKSQKEKQG
jgi:hypothetical protein